MKLKNIDLKNISLALTALAIVLYTCCNTSVDSVPDTDDIKISWNFVPFHLEQKPPANADEFFNNLNSKYPSFSKLFFSTILPVYNEQSELQIDLLTDTGLAKLVDTCMLVFNDLDGTEADFDKAFKNYAFYTDDYHIPNIYTFVSGFAYQTFIFMDDNKDGLGIGLDMFLGSHFPYKNIDKSNPGFSSYLTQYFDKKYLIRKALLTWLDDKIAVSRSSELLDIIIRNGKIIYILEKILPLIPKDVILEFRPEEYQWCLQNETALWAHLLKEDLLYEDDFSKINKLVNPSPGAAGIPELAPGGVANYIGWRVVQDYMHRTESNISQLILEENPQHILKTSKYKPRDRIK